MTYIDQGMQGAFRQTWRKGNPRALLKTLLEKNPKADATAIYKMFWEEIQDDKDLVRDIVGYWLDHNYHSLKQAEMPIKNKQAAQKQKAAAVEQLKERIHQESKIILLDLLMPNSKRLADCTGAECGRFNGWMAQLANTVPPNKTVGSVLSEDQIYQLWQKASRRPK